MSGGSESADSPDSPVARRPGPPTRTVPAPQQRLVSAMIRQMDSCNSTVSKRGRGESESPAQRAAKSRDTGGDWEKYEAMLDTAMDRLRLQIQSDFEEFRNTMKQQFLVMGQRLKKVEDRLEEREAELARTQAGVQDTQRELRQLQAQVEENERVSRLPALILSGTAVPKKPPASQLPAAGESVEQLAVDLLRRHFPDLQVARRDVDRAHRLPGRGDPRIICRFVQSGAGSVRDTVYQRRLDLRGSGLFISECLSRKRAEVLRTLLEAKKDGKLYTVFSRQGHVYYKLQKAGENVRADSVQEVLQKFMA